jgi:hypothetical protein
MTADRPNRPSGPEKLLWITRRHGNPAAGDAIYDTRVLRAIGRTHQVTHLELDPEMGRAGRFARALLRRIPPDRAAYATARNIDLLRSAAAGCDAVVLSHEIFDWAADCLDLPAVLVLHNVTSDYMPAAGLAARLHAALVTGHEARTYRERPHRAIVALSVADRDLLARRGLAPSAAIAWPGMPPLTPLADDAVVEARPLLDGTYNWGLKLRDLARFAQEYARLRPDLRPILTGGALPPEADGIYDACRETADPSQAIRFGISTDRFAAGFKLKIGAFIAANAIPVSFADIFGDYAGLPHADRLLVKVDSVAEIRPRMDAIAAWPEAPRAFREFKQAAAERFRWDAAAQSIAEAAHAACASAG